MFDHITAKYKDLMIAKTTKLEYQPSRIKSFPAQQLSKYKLNPKHTPTNYLLTLMLEWRPPAQNSNYEERVKKIEEKLIQLERTVQEMKRRKIATGKYFSSDSSFFIYFL